MAKNRKPNKANTKPQVLRRKQPDRAVKNKTRAKTQPEGKPVPKKTQKRKASPPKRTPANQKHKPQTTNKTKYTAKSTPANAKRVIPKQPNKTTTKPQSRASTDCPDRNKATTSGVKRKIHSDSTPGAKKIQKSEVNSESSSGSTSSSSSSSSSSTESILGNAAANGSLDLDNLSLSDESQALGSNGCPEQSSDSNNDEPMYMESGWEERYCENDDGQIKNKKRDEAICDNDDRESIRQMRIKRFSSSPSDSVNSKNHKKND